MKKRTIAKKSMAAGALAGALTLVAVWALDNFGMKVPPAIAGAIGIILQTLVHEFYPEA